MKKAYFDHIRMINFLGNSLNFADSNNPQCMERWKFDVRIRSTYLSHPVVKEEKKY